MAVGLERGQHQLGDFEIPGFRPGDHVFFPYVEDHESDAGIVAFIREGFLRGERCAYAAPPASLVRVEKAVWAAGVDFDSAITRGALVMLPAKLVYGSNGSFDVDHTIAFLGTQIDQAQVDGFTGLRGAGEFDFALTTENDETAHRYECRINDAFVGRPFTALCAYGSRLVSGGVATEMLCAHPRVLTRGTRHENPFFFDSSRGPFDRSGPGQLGTMLDRIVVADQELAHQRDLIAALITSVANPGPCSGADWDQRRDQRHSPGSPRPIVSHLQSLRRALRDGVSPSAPELLTWVEGIWAELRRAAEIPEGDDSRAQDQDPFDETG